MPRKKKTTEEFKKEISRLTNGKYEVIGAYINNKTKIEILHKACGSAYFVKPNVFLNGKRCPVCRKKREWTVQKLTNFLNFQYKNEYTVLGNFKNVHEKVKLKHLKCGNVYEQNVLDILYHKAQCPVCSRKRRGNPEKFKEKIIHQLGPNYELYGEYINNRTTVTLKHLCGHIFSCNPKHLTPCPKCQLNRIDIEIRDNLHEYKIAFESNVNIGKDTVVGFLVNKKIVIEYYSERDYKDREIYKKNKQKREVIKDAKYDILVIPYWHYNDIDRILFFLKEFLKTRYSHRKFIKFKKSMKLLSFQKYKIHKSKEGEEKWEK